MSNQNTPHRSKLDSAKLLILGMEGLRAGGFIPVSREADKAASTFHNAVTQQKLSMTLTCAVVLYPIVVELVLKHIWEQEQGKTAKYDHNVHSLFLQLNPETRRDVETLYDRCCQEYKTAIDIGRQQLGTEVMAVDMANLEEALRWNEDAVKNLKYEMTPRGPCVPTGAIWTSKHIWLVPGTFPNFAIKLTRWQLAAASRGLHPPK